MRRATKDDLDHLLEVANLKTGTGKNITGDGGDYVREAWLEDWWTHDPRTHYEEFAFVGGLPVGFARCDCYGPPDDLDSGWLEGLRVHPEWQGKKVMTRLQAHLMRGLPEKVREHTYLAVGSTNSQMIAICHAGGDVPKYQYIGAWVMHAFTGSATAALDGHTARLLGTDDMDTCWSFLAGNPLCAEGRLLLPARFYSWRHLTRRALEDKLAHKRVIAVSHPSTVGVVALFVQFDSDFAGWPLQTRCRFYLSYFLPSVYAPGTALGAILHTFARSAPSTDEQSGEALTTIVVAGPHDNSASGDAASCDVDPQMSEALTAAGFTRPRDTHLRVYHVPSPPSA